MANRRNAVAAMALSAAAFVTILTSEDYTEQAVIPTKNDRPTVGFGSTFNEAGKPVQMGDRITPTRAVRLAASHLSKEENKFRDSLPGVMLTQAEYDIYMNWVYQYGIGRWMESSMRRELLVSHYPQACDALLLYKKSGGYDCSIPGNKICYGVWVRQLKRHQACMGAQ